MLQATLKVRSVQIIYFFLIQFWWEVEKSDCEKNQNFFKRTVEFPSGLAVGNLALSLLWRRLLLCLGLIPGPGTSSCQVQSKKKRKKAIQKPLDLTNTLTTFVGIFLYQCSQLPISLCLFITLNLSSSLCTSKVYYE